SGDAVPAAVRCSPNACDLVPATPVHADIAMHPFVTGTLRSALTARICPGLVPASGKFWTFVARYVAIEMVPSLTKSTSWYLLPTGVYGMLVSTSVTESMMLPVRPPGAPNQKTVARMASPRWGLVGLKPLITNVPLPHVPLCWSNWMGSPAAATAPEGRETWCSGLAASLQCRLSKAAARSIGTRARVRPFFIVLTSLPRMLRLCRMSGGKASARTFRLDDQARRAVSVARLPPASLRLCVPVTG